MSDTYKWSPFTARCRGCRQIFRLSWDAVADCIENESFGEDETPDQVEARARAFTLSEVVDGVEFCLHCVSGNDAPLEEYVSDGVDETGRRAVASFLYDGIAFFALKDHGTFYAVNPTDNDHRRDALLYVPMLANGTPATDETFDDALTLHGARWTEPDAIWSAIRALPIPPVDIGEVTAMESPERLAAINALFGTRYDIAQFAGR